MQYKGVPTPGEQVIPSGQNLFKIGVLFLLLFGAFVVGHYGADAIDESGDAGWMTAALQWGWLLLCGSIASVAAQGLGILAHDAVHKVMIKNGRLNELVGGLISAFALIPFNANRQFHMTHHRFSHQKGLDPEQPMHNHHLLFSITIGSFIALSLQYRFLLANLLSCFAQPRRMATVLMDIIYISIALCVYLVLLPKLGISVHHSLVPMLLTLPLVFGIRAISDHYGLPAVSRKEKDVNGNSVKRDAIQVQHEVSGWVVLTSPLLEWLWSNVNYHEVHHKFPYLSHRYLRQTLEATKDHLPYAIADGYLRNLWRHRRRDYYNSILPESER
jgi:fatty acid desaturase